MTAHGAHYTLQEVTDFVQFCQNLGLEVIPLVQTFGHLEYVLKVREARIIFQYFSNNN